MPRKKKPTRPQPQRGQVHGERGQQEAAVQEVAQAARSVAPPAFGGAVPPAPQVVPLDAPSQRPDEPVTSGMVSGSGVGPEGLRLGSSEVDHTVALLRGVYETFPNEDVRRLIEFAQRRQVGAGGVRHDDLRLRRPRRGTPGVRSPGARAFPAGTGPGRPRGRGPAQPAGGTDRGRGSVRHPARGAVLMLTVATDGAAIGNPGRGGWGWVTEDGRQGSGGERHTTNNRMELQAVLAALRAIDHPKLRILSDPTYVVDTFTKWLPGWRAKGRLSPDAKRPVKNVDLIERISERLIGREVIFEWVRGHNGHPLNEAADALANGAAERAANDPDAEVDQPGGQRTLVYQGSAPETLPERRVIRSTVTGETSKRTRQKLAERSAEEDSYQQLLAAFRRRRPGPPPGARGVPRTERPRRAIRGRKRSVVENSGARSPSGSPRGVSTGRLAPHALASRAAAQAVLGL